MIFAEVPIEKGKGAVLAHSVAVSGRRLKKGLLLAAEHITALKQMGHKTVTVARLEKDDVGEDFAAQTLAQALLSGNSFGLRAGSPFTGRVNIIANGPGIIDQDIEKIIALNSIDPMVTCATVPQYQQMNEGGLVATVKIISYSVPKRSLLDACGFAKGALRLLPPVIKTASLLISDTAGGAGDKGLDAISSRLEALDIALLNIVRVPHEVSPMAYALSAFKTDLSLILTSSATSDLNDTAPNAVRQAGGQLLRFGMPVDPGNLLFLGSLANKPVIGLPGCARSPKLNGADWVLSRVACGITCDMASFASMSVGGLLKEIPTRPQPRRSKKG